MASSRTRTGIAAAAFVAAGGAALAVHRQRTGYAEQGYELDGDLDVGAPEFLRALEAQLGQTTMLRCLARPSARATICGY